MGMASLGSVLGVETVQAAADQTRSSCQRMLARPSEALT